MHVKFIDKWCELYDTMWEEQGKTAAIKFLREKLNPDQLALVNKRFPAYAQQKKEQHVNG